METFLSAMKEISEHFLNETKKINERSQLREFEKVVGTIYDDNNIDQFLNSVNPKLNSINWAMIAIRQLEEIKLGCSWMLAFSSWYFKNHDENSGPRSEEHTSELQSH